MTIFVVLFNRLQGSDKKQEWSISTLLADLQYRFYYKEEHHTAYF